MLFKGLNTCNNNARFYEVTKIGNSKHSTPKATSFKPLHVTDEQHRPEA